MLLKAELPVTVAVPPVFFKDSSSGTHRNDIGEITKFTGAPLKGKSLLLL